MHTSYLKFICVLLRPCAQMPNAKAASMCAEAECRSAEDATNCAKAASMYAKAAYICDKAASMCVRVATMCAKTTTTCSMAAHLGELKLRTILKSTGGQLCFLQ